MIVLVFTGGTISMKHDPTVRGAVPALAGKDILDLVPQLRELGELEIDDFGAYPGPHMTADLMWALRERVEAHLRRPEVQGVVITHGTD
jgi:L-asparaginase